MQGLIGHGEKFGVYSKYNRKLLDFNGVGGSGL